MPTDPDDDRLRIGWRPEIPADAPLVRAAHAEHRRSLLAGLPWPADALARLCDAQHDALERHLAAAHPDADRRMIVVGREAAGRVCLDRVASVWRIADIVVAPAMRGRGIGTAALRLILAEADAAGAAVDLHVGLDNPRAEALYRRLGFVDAPGDGGANRRLVRTPGGDYSAAGR